MTDPQRVHLVHQGFGDYVDGLVDGLRSLDGPGVEVAVTTVTSGPASMARPRSAGSDHRSVAVPRFRDPRSPLAAAGVVRRILERPCDVLHWQAAGNPWVDLAFLRWLGRGRPRPPVVVTVHDMQPHPGDRSVLPGTFRVIRRLVRRADQVIVHAPHIRDQAVAAGASPAAISVLPHGELASRYLPPDRLPLGPPTERTVLFFGRAQYYKGLDLLVEAMDEVVRRVPDARLMVAGSGPSIDEALPPGEALPPWCALHRGLVPADGVAGLFERAAVVALPYREASQSGVAALAAGFGRPVIASRLPGLSDIVDDDRTGILVEPGSAPALAQGLIDLLTDGPRADRLAAGAGEAARGRLAWPVIAGDLLDVYLRARSADRTSPEPEWGGSVR